MTYSDTLLTVEHQTIVHTQHELEQEQEYEQQLQDARNGLGALLFCQKPTQTSSTAT
ncbi:MAG: hypothetical protein ACLTUD_10070 [Bifidobacterium catenulatum]